MHSNSDSKYTGLRKTAKDPCPSRLKLFFINTEARIKKIPIKAYDEYKHAVDEVIEALKKINDEFRGTSSKNKIINQALLKSSLENAKAIFSKLPQTTRFKNLKIELDRQVEIFSNEISTPKNLKPENEISTQIKNFFNAIIDFFMMLFPQLSRSEKTPFLVLEEGQNKETEHNQQQTPLK